MTLEDEGRFEALARQARDLRDLDARRWSAKLKAPPLTPEGFDRGVEELLAQADELATPEEREAAREAAGVTGEEAPGPPPASRPPPAGTKRTDRQARLNAVVAGTRPGAGGVAVPLSALDSDHATR